MEMPEPDEWRRPLPEPEPFGWVDAVSALAWVAVALLFVFTCTSAKAAGLIGDDGYLYDDACGSQAASCTYSNPYSIRFGHGATWSFLGELGPGSVVCPTSADASSQCFYYTGGVAPSGPARAAQGAGGAEGAGTSTPPASGASVGTVNLVLPAFLNLSAEDGQTIGVAILTAWAAAWAWRMVIKALSVADSYSVDD